MGLPLVNFLRNQTVGCGAMFSDRIGGLGMIGSGGVVELSLGKMGWLLVGGA